MHKQTTSKRIYFFQKIDFFKSANSSYCVSLNHILDQVFCFKADFGLPIPNNTTQLSFSETPFMLRIMFHIRYRGMGRLFSALSAPQNNPQMGIWQPKMHSFSTEGKSLTKQDIDIWFPSGLNKPLYTAYRLFHGFSITFLVFPSSL